MLNSVLKFLMIYWEKRQVLHTSKGWLMLVIAMILEKNWKLWYKNGGVSHSQVAQM